jgi:hypothetical protein
MNSSALDSNESLYHNNGDLDFVRARLRIVDFPEDLTFYIRTNNSEVTTIQNVYGSRESVYCSYNRILQYRFSLYEV